MALMSILFSDEPVVTLELGSNLNSSAIREGIDVYFECNIKSNPWVYKVSWRHNVSLYSSARSLGESADNESGSEIDNISRRSLIASR